MLCQVSSTKTLGIDTAGGADWVDKLAVAAAQSVLRWDEGDTPRGPRVWLEMIYGPLSAGKTMRILSDAWMF